VLDSTPTYDAVATQDTITLIRSAIRGLLCAADHVLRAQLRAVISSGDAYTDASSSRVHRMLVVASSALLGRSL
jgi:hypothetical protein